MRRLRSIRRPFFAFLGAAVLLCGIFAALGFVPFGGRSLLINDLNIQYVEYLKYLHTRLLVTTQYISHRCSSTQRHSFTFRLSFFISKRSCSSMSFFIIFYFLNTRIP